MGRRAYCVDAGGVDGGDSVVQAVKPSVTLAMNTAGGGPRFPTLPQKARKDGARGARGDADKAFLPCKFLHKPDCLG